MLLYVSLLSIFFSLVSAQFQFSIGKTGIKIHGGFPAFPGLGGGHGGDHGEHFGQPIPIGPAQGDHHASGSAPMAYPFDGLYNANIMKSLAVPFEMAEKAFPFSIRVATKGKPHVPTIQLGVHPFGQSSVYSGQPSGPLEALGTNTHGVGHGLDSIGANVGKHLSQLFSGGLGSLASGGLGGLGGLGSLKLGR